MIETDRDDYISPIAARNLARIFDGLTQHFLEGKWCEGLAMNKAIQDDLARRMGKTPLPRITL